MSKEYQVLVFGKAGCQKCDMLKRRLDKILAAEEWQDFEKEYCDLGTTDGLVQFCKAECLNPSQIPAMLVTRRDPHTGDYAPVASHRPGDRNPLCGKSQLYQHVGLQTDYSAAGKGLLTPKMIAAVLDEARSTGN